MHLNIFPKYFLIEIHHLLLYILVIFSVYFITLIKAVVLHCYSGIEIEKEHVRKKSIEEMYQ